MTNTDTQKSHHLCPHCFKNPPPDADAAQQGEMRCFKCTHNCPLASVKESPVRPCAKCGQPVRPSRCRRFSSQARVRAEASVVHVQMVLKKNKDGSFRLGCKGYPSCKEVIWLPKAATRVEVESDDCGCGSKRLCFEFKVRLHPSRVCLLHKLETWRANCRVYGQPGSVQPGMLSQPPNRHTACIVCSDPVLQSLGIRGSGGGAAVGYGGSPRQQQGRAYNGAPSYQNLQQSLGAQPARQPPQQQPYPQQQQQQQQPARPLGQQPNGGPVGGSARAGGTKRVAPGAPQHCPCGGVPVRRKDASGKFFLMCGFVNNPNRTPCDFHRWA